MPFSTRMSAKEYVKKVKDAGGIGFLAHPHEKRTHMKEHPPYPWIEWDTEDFTGIEIWNHMSEWMENLTEQNKYQNFVHPLKSITKPPEETLKLWDKLNLNRRVAGIGGVDAHAHKYNVLGFFEVEIFPYKVLFKSIRTHVLTQNEILPGKGRNGLPEAKKMIYGSLGAEVVLLLTIITEIREDSGFLRKETTEFIIWAIRYMMRGNINSECLCPLLKQR